ncbi:MAG: peptidase M64 [Bacteroidales bacterium]|nr:peptidase M64 [Bacteroidales bacterium]
MKGIGIKLAVVALLCAGAATGGARAQDGVPETLDARLSEATLRVDYIFSGTDKESGIAVDELNRLDGWAGRRRHMQDVPLRGNGQVCMTEAATGDTLYRTSFSTLFQEWQATEEATRLRKSFENVFLLPMPSVPVDITVELYDFHDRVVATLTHPVDPEDILIRPKGGFSQDDVRRYAAEGGALSPKGVPARYVHYSGSPEDCIDVVILAEGYTEAERDIFFADAEAAAESLFNHEPYASLSDRFNILAVAAASADSGVSVPREGLWKDTAIGSHFDTFYSNRYLTTLRLKQLHDALAEFPYEHIIILANTDTYGGGGIYNSYTLTTAHHAQFKPVVVHEFGHSFAGLADEYFYDDQYVEMYYPDTEPWEPNITTLADFASKWQDLLPAGTVLPNGEVVADLPDGRGARSILSRILSRRDARSSAGAGSARSRQARARRLSIEGVGLYEGAGYQSKGVWRGAEDCRMRTNSASAFCPVCQQAIADLIDFYTAD